MTDAKHDCYTLLADASSVYADAEEHRAFFRAHLIYNLLLNGGIVFSDNQVICSKNLRHLARWDGAIKVLFERGVFGLAARQGFRDDPAHDRLRSIHQAFVIEGKTHPGELPFDEYPELAFIERHSRLRPWNYDQVRTTFTETCRSMLHREFERILSPVDFTHFKDMIAVEERRDVGLGREFLQRRLPLKLSRLQTLSDVDVGQVLRLCTDAPYVSNLPRTIGLNPIYAPEHQKSFQLVRGYHYRFEDIESPIVDRAKLDWEHFVHGLNRLDLTDIEALQASPAGVEYRTLIDKAANDISQFDNLHESFIEFNRVIEDRIVSRFAAIARHSPAAQARTFRKQRVTAAVDGSNLMLDLLCSAFNVGVPGLGFFMGKMIDMVGGAAKGPDRIHHDAATHERKVRDLGRYLQSKDQALRISFENDIVTTESFAAEIIVA